MLLLPNNATWTPPSWITTTFFREACSFFAAESVLAPHIQACADRQLDQLDLRGADANVVSELLALVTHVQNENIRLRGSNFHNPQMYAAYVEQLDALRKVAGALLGLR
jgi:hypothetical protein